MYDSVQAAGGAAPPPANGAATSPLLEEDVHNVSHCLGWAAQLYSLCWVGSLVGCECCLRLQQLCKSVTSECR